MRVGAAARTLEAACRTGDSEDAARLVAELRQASHQASGALRQWLEAVPAKMAADVRPEPGPA
jgi:hypothetical protein